jgi:hypothetical protein
MLRQRLLGETEFADATDDVLKLDEDRRLVFGWAYRATNPDGSLRIDKQGDFIDDPAELEDMAYHFALESRLGDEMHYDVPVADLVESMAFTPEKLAKMGVPDGTLPMAWWVGFKVRDDRVWQEVKSGRYKGFSVGGSGHREYLDADDLAKGDFEGHPFRGNQYVKVPSRGKTPPTASHALSRVTSKPGRPVEPWTNDEPWVKEAVAHYDATGELTEAVLDHLELVTATNKRYMDAGLDTKGYYTDPETGGYIAERRKLHDEIIDEIMAEAANVPRQAEVAMTGGLPGAGKSTMLKDPRAGLPKELYLNISNDDLKVILAERAGLPDEFEELDYFKPMELAELYHEEAADLSKRLADAASEVGVNFIWDITMSNPGQVHKRLKPLLDDNGPKYKLRLLFMDVPVEVSKQRIRKRYMDSLLTPLGGRYVPESVVEESRDPVYSSVNRRAFEEVKHLADRGWQVWDGTQGGRLVAAG